MFCRSTKQTQPSASKTCAAYFTSARRPTLSRRLQGIKLWARSKTTFSSAAQSLDCIISWLLCARSTCHTSNQLLFSTPRSRQRNGISYATSSRFTMCKAPCWNLRILRVRGPYLLTRRWSCPTWVLLLTRKGKTTWSTRIASLRIRVSTKQTGQRCSCVEALCRILFASSSTHTISPSSWRRRRPLTMNLRSKTTLSLPRLRQEMFIFRRCWTCWLARLTTTSISSPFFSLLLSGRRRRQPRQWRRTLFSLATCSSLEFPTSSSKRPTANSSRPSL
mmetsp:Transcript_16/g.33  ORF Transcript_16/g.33 Transcript_16/m.33 type:complete len:277 (-) Transcript_16:522-1352(-)